MNSDNDNTESTPATGQAAEQTTARRSRARRPSSRTATATSAETNANEITTPVPAAEIATAAPTTTRPARRSRSRAAAEEPPAAASAPTADDSPMHATTIVPLSTGDALVSDGTTGQVADDEPLTRSRRRRSRGRGGRAATDGIEAPAEGAEGEPAAIAPIVDMATEPIAPESLATETMEVETASGRRRRRRGRGGRNGAENAAAAEADTAGDAVSTPALAESDMAAPPTEETTLSPATLRRFDHRDWRDRPHRAGSGSRFTQRPAAAPTPVPSTAPVAAPPAALEDPAPEIATARPVPFRRSERGDRYGDRPPRVAAQAAEPQLATPDVAAISTAPIVTPPPIVMPATAIPPAMPATAIPPAMPTPSRGGSLEERIESLLAAQNALMQQQQRAIEAMSGTLAALQNVVARMTTTGIAAGMPRAGIFVDAPNVVYAAESARVNIDYGRMLDFLSRGREMVHAIVYAPVTEESGFRFEGQRFVAPFLRKGYKLVTKPLKRFPDGTAKGNFDIELAIDIVTMSQRLDVVILISGDSDFSRLIELIQSRGVRVEVVAFASNVSWELVQMADVFIDIGEYMNEFRAT